jgi:hypothetical protein
MHTFHAAFVRCLAWALPATALGGAALVATSIATDSIGPWLHAAAFLPIAASCLAVTAFWPLFAKDGDAREWVRRATRRPLHGMLHAALGSLCASLLCLLALAIAAAPFVPTPHARSAAQPIGRPILDDSQTLLSFDVGAACKELRLRPIAMMPHGELAPACVEVAVDGKRITDEPISFEGTRQLAVVPLDGRQVQRIELRLVRGSIPLLFDQDAAVIVSPDAKSTLLGCAMALLVMLVPACVALALSMATGAIAALPVQQALALTALLVQTAGQAGPADAALTLCARGHWLPSEGLLPSISASLLVAALFAIAATLAKKAAQP